MSDHNHESQSTSTSPELRLQHAVARIYATCKVAATNPEVPAVVSKVLLDQADELADALGHFQTVSPSLPQHSLSPSLETERLTTTCSQENKKTYTAQTHENWQALLNTYPPRRGGCNRVKAEKSFARLTLTEQRACIEGAAMYRKMCDTTGKTRTEYVCMLTTFINQKRWVELIEEPPVTNNDSLVLQALEVGNLA